MVQTQQSVFAPTSGGAPYIVRLPFWAIIARSVSLVLAGVIVVLAGLIIHDVELDSSAFALACVSTPGHA